MSDERRNAIGGILESQAVTIRDLQRQVRMIEEKVNRNEQRTAMVHQTLFGSEGQGGLLRELARARSDVRHRWELRIMAFTTTLTAIFGIANLLVSHH